MYICLFWYPYCVRLIMGIYSKPFMGRLHTNITMPTLMKTIFKLK